MCYYGNAQVKFLNCPSFDPDWYYLVARLNTIDPCVFP
jgi:hypothetical protein